MGAAEQLWRTKAGRERPVAAKTLGEHKKVSKEISQIICAYGVKPVIMLQIFAVYTTVEKDPYLRKN